MDPKATLEALDQELSNLDDLARVFELIDAYSAWRLKGGHEPRILPTVLGCISGDALFSRLLTIAADRASTGQFAGHN